MFSSAQSYEAVRQKAAQWLTQGISPRRLALTLALGFAIGCIPVLGIPTVLCALVALAFRLNQPAIQAANYAAMPFQLALIVPFVRLGAWLVPSVAPSPLNLAAVMHAPLSTVTHAPVQVVAQLEVPAGQALLGWLLVAIPVVLLLTPTLTVLLRRIPALAAVEAAD